MPKKILTAVILAVFTVLVIPTAATAAGYVPDANIMISGGG